LADVVDQLPDELRSVFTLRVVEGLDTLETAECLSLSTANVKTRLHRARQELRTRVDAKIGEDIRKLYQFDGQRCDRIVDNVMKRLHQLSNDARPK
jgi:RNA polymerase sigma-70 factor (ECF subfamily)